MILLMSLPHYCVSAFYSEDLLYNRCRVYYQAGFSTHKHNTYKFTLAPCTTQDTGLPCTLRGVSYGALNYVEFRAAMHPTSCMAEREGCAHPLRSFRLPSVAEPIPLPRSGKGSHPNNMLKFLACQPKPWRRLAEREGFEPSIPF